MRKNTVALFALHFPRHKLMVEICMQKKLEYESSFKTLLAFEMMQNLTA
jgi:hypothetical protein